MYITNRTIDSIITNLLLYPDWFFVEFKDQIEIYDVNGLIIILNTDEDCEYFRKQYKERS